MPAVKPSLGVSPFVPIEDSVHEDYIICLEDGKQLQMLKRHLKTLYSMTLDQYRERWNLPESYPMVAPSYARRRSEIAKNIGLGRGNKKASMKMVQGESSTQGQDIVGVVKI
jgi:predicted transcriptional regulator